MFTRNFHKTCTFLELSFIYQLSLETQLFVRIFLRKGWCNVRTNDILPECCDTIGYNGVSRGYALYKEAISHSTPTTSS